MIDKVLSMVKISHSCYSSAQIIEKIVVYVVFQQEKSYIEVTKFYLMINRHFSLTITVTMPEHAVAPSASSIESEL